MLCTLLDDQFMRRARSWFRESLLNYPTFSSEEKVWKTVLHWNA